MPFPEILVLGATGRIGQILQICWESRGLTGSVLWQGRHDRSRYSAADADLAWAVFDPLKEPEALYEAARGRAIILCLAGVIPGRPGVLTDNQALACAAVRAGAKSGARVFLTSSAAVYGNGAGRLVETTALAPVADYGRSKADMEREATRLGIELGVSVCSLRIGNIAGLDAILGRWAPGFSLDVFADGTSPRRSYVGIEDLAQVLADLMMCPDLPQALNVAAPEVLEMGHLLDAADLPWTSRPAPDTAIREVRLDTGLLQGLVASGKPTSDPARMVAQWQRVRRHQQRKDTAQ